MSRWVLCISTQPRCLKVISCAGSRCHMAVAITLAPTAARDIVTPLLSGGVRAITLAELQAIKSVRRSSVGGWIRCSTKMDLHVCMYARTPPHGMNSDETIGKIVNSHCHLIVVTRPSDVASMGRVQTGHGGGSTIDGDYFPLTHVLKVLRCTMSYIHTYIHTLHTSYIHATSTHIAHGFILAFS
eukprot:COSAG01_NODE_9012_length_2583_cov_3.407005_5_plen_185_part_00